MPILGRCASLCMLFAVLVFFSALPPCERASFSVFWARPGLQDLGEVGLSCMHVLVV